MEVPLSTPILDDGRGLSRRRSSQVGGRRTSSMFRRNSDLAAAMGTESILLKLSHRRSEEELAKVKKFLLETEGLKQLCSSIPEGALDELCQYVKIEDYAPEELICREADPGDKLHFILSGTATEYKSTGAIEKNLQRIDSGDRLSSMSIPEGGSRSGRPHTAGARLSTASRASVASLGPRASVFSVSSVHQQEDYADQGGQKKFRGVRSIQMPFLRVNMAEKEENQEEVEQRMLEEERLRALSGLYATSPPRSIGGNSRASSPEHDRKQRKNDSPPNPGQIRRASQMLRSRAMSRRESMSRSMTRNQRKSRYVSNAFAGSRMSMMTTGNYRLRGTGAAPALMEHGLKYGYLTTFDSFGELMIFHAEKHKLSVIAGQDGCLILTIDRGAISRIHNGLASEGRQFLTAMKLWASRRILKKQPAKRHDVDLNTCATLLSELEFFEKPEA